MRLEEVLEKSSPCRLTTEGMVAMTVERRQQHFARLCRMKVGLQSIEKEENYHIKHPIKRINDSLCLVYIYL